MVLNNPLFVSRNSRSSGYQIEQSLRFNAPDSNYLYKTYPTPGASTTWTFSTWLKRGTPGTNQYIAYTRGNNSGLVITSTGELRWDYYVNSANTGVYLRDHSAWYHIYATGTATTGVRGTVKIYLNGLLVYTGTDLTEGWLWRSGQDLAIGRYGNYDGFYTSMYLAEMQYCDNINEPISKFAETDQNGVWVPVNPETQSITYNNLGFYLKFDPTATNGLGHDHKPSGTAFNWTAYNFTTSGTGTDVLSDTPTTNWCVMNPNDNGTSNITLSNGNLSFAAVTTWDRGVKGTFAVSSGKWYWEYTHGTIVSSSQPGADLGITKYTSIINSHPNGGATSTDSYILAAHDGELHNGSYTGTSYGSAASSGDIISIALDLDNGKIWWAKNGTWFNSGNPASGTNAGYTGLSGTFYPLWYWGISPGTGGVNLAPGFNFGQRDFEYTPPSGFLPLNTSNLPAPTIKDGSDYFATIVGPGDTETAWSETNTAVSVSGGQLTTYDGLANTEHLLGRTDTKYPPIDFIRTLRELELDGYDDWYLGSQYEMEVIYYNLKPTTDNNTTVADSQDNAYSVPQRTTANYTAGTPSQTSVTAFQSGGAQAFDSETSTGFVYYTSSAPSTNAANGKSFTAAGIAAGYNYNSGQKYSEYGLTRAIRRVAYTGSEPSLGAAYGGGYYAGLYSLNGDGTATHALIVSDKANGENTGMKALVQQKFSSGLYWIKDRQASDEHKWIDSVRGLTNQLSSNLTTAETTYSDPDNASVAWNWLAGGSGSSNTAGSITSTVSANPTAGFSIVTYAGSGTGGDSIGHGLGVPPKMIIAKSRGGGPYPTASWAVYHESIGASKSLALDTTAAAAGPYSNPGTIWYNTTPTSTVFYVGNLNETNGSNNYVAYCFAEVEGYSKFGSYIGNGSSDGPFVYCGFKPAFVMIKVTDQVTTSWMMRDDKRDTDNPNSAYLLPNDSLQEYTNLDLDFLSNGFKPRHTNGVENVSGKTYIFAAFASNPFGGSGVSPATAR